MRGKPIPFGLTAWIGAGIVRVLLASSTSAIAYFFFGLFWLISFVLVIAAVRQLAASKSSEEMIEAICICLAVVALFLQGLIGSGKAVPAAAVVFLVSATILLFIYGRRLWRGTLHPSIGNSD